MLTCTTDSNQVLAIGEEVGEEIMRDSFLLGMGYDFKGSGKDEKAPKMDSVFTKLTVDTLDYPIIDGELVAALEQHLRLSLIHI